MKKVAKNPRSRLGKMRMRYCLTIVGIFSSLFIVLLLGVSVVNLLLDPSPYIRLLLVIGVIGVSLWLTDRYMVKNIARFLLHPDESDDAKRPQRRADISD